jgi:hypothetical protein
MEGSEEYWLRIEVVAIDVLAVTRRCGSAHQCQSECYKCDWSR